LTIGMLDLKSEYEELRQEIDAALRAVLESGRFILGPQVEAFEAEVAEYVGVRRAVAVASGTDALMLALTTLDLEPGDEVITTPFTFIATASTIVHAGGIPVFVDIDPQTFNIDPNAVEAAITGRTRAVVPVHLYGHPADVDGIVAVCRRHGLAMVEDCAQSFGASQGGRRTGSFGGLGCFSFYPSKNLGAYGDAGMVTTDDEQVADRLRKLRNQGSGLDGDDVIGYNSRLDELQAAVLRVKLRHLDRFTTIRRRLARLQTALLDGAAVVAPTERPGSKHVYQQYTIRLARRSRVQDGLAANRIGSRIYYPVPLHRYPAFRQRAHAEFPHADAACEEALSIPLHPFLRADQIERVAEVIHACA
jgi:dTDP-4-amino-4,6-dideoxygalactose transaminase